METPQTIHTDLLLLEEIADLVETATPEKLEASAAFCLRNVSCLIEAAELLDPKKYHLARSAILQKAQFWKQLATAVEKKHRDLCRSDQSSSGPIEP